MATADPHRAFVTAWRDFGVRHLLADHALVGPPDAWFKVCSGTRWWDDDRLPPEKPVAPPRPNPNRWVGTKKRKLSAPRKVTVRVLSSIGRDLVEWAGVGRDDSTFARHRDREAEFRAKIERELKQLRKDDEWPLAV